MHDRDLTLFPFDDHGDALWRMAAQGDDLQAPREIEFSVVFAAHHQAEAFAAYMETLGFKVGLREQPDQPENLPWNVTVAHAMVPTHAGLAAFELMLEEEAAVGEGVTDGWAAAHRP